ncbi:MATE family efflux transporter [Sphaerisporangium melleum]|uniref:MATE family efflux transporter n=1 Tax=Sphaerisporangium melleum TaxID=321316 RepID=A0A917VPD2_9ACTN|nr:MATE family efflux transporter [Sphaerisporangium melleum]GGL01206.1 MATE family efflux transporter [Sphaerisporangium melleum]GII71662.1 MATE family efflux transporter [Sphaerisporangium melleum]
MALTPRVGGREILRLAVPAFGALVAEPLFILVDYAIVGRLGTAAVGALGIAGTALTTLVNICVFLAYGTTAAVARQVGAGHVERAVKQGIDGLWLATGIGLVLLAAGWPLAPAIVEWFGAAPEVFDGAVTYLRISLFGVPAMLVVLAGTGILRGLQDTVTPLAVAIGSFALNAVLNAVFVLLLHWGIAGSAWGTVLAQGLGAAVYLVVAARAARTHRVSLRPDLAGVRASGTAGIALIIRTVCLRIVLIVATAVATRMGVAQLAAHAIATQIWSLLAYALDALAIAGQAIVGRTLGAGQTAHTRAATRTMVVWGIGYGAVLGVALIALRPVIPHLFDASPDVAEQLVAVLWPVALSQPLSGVVFVLDGVLIGAGDRRYLAWASAVTAAVYLPAAYAVVHLGGGLVALWIALGLWMTARLVTLGARAYGRAWLVTGG